MTGGRDLVHEDHYVRHGERPVRQGLPVVRRVARRRDPHGRPVHGRQGDADGLARRRSGAGASRGSRSARPTPRRSASAWASSRSTASRPTSSTAPTRPSRWPRRSAATAASALDIFHMNIEEADWRRRSATPATTWSTSTWRTTTGCRRGRAPSTGRRSSQELAGIGYDGYLTVEFVVPVDRTPLSKRTEIADAAESGASQGMEQFLRDHGTGAVPEHYYDEYVQDSIDRLRKARRVGPDAGRLTRWPPHPGHRARRHPRHQGRGDRVRPRPAAGAGHAAGGDRLRDPRRARLCGPDVSREEVARAGGHDLDDSPHARARAAPPSS